MMQQNQDLELLRDIPGYKAILKALIKSQIQHLVEQLANHGDEEAVLLTASITDGSLSHLGSESGRVFLDSNEDIKSKFLGFCLKRHHKAQTSEPEPTNVYQPPPSTHRASSSVPHRRPRTGSYSPRNHFTPATSPYSNNRPRQLQQRAKFSSTMPITSNFNISTPIPVTLSSVNTSVSNYTEGQGHMMQGQGHGSESEEVTTVKIEKRHGDSSESGTFGDHSLLQGESSEQTQSESLPQSQKQEDSNSATSVSMGDNSMLSSIKIEAVTEEDLELEITGVEMANSAEGVQMSGSADWPSMSDGQVGNQSFDKEGFGPGLFNSSMFQSNAKGRGIIPELYNDASIGQELYNAASISLALNSSTDMVENLQGAAAINAKSLEGLYNAGGNDTTYAKLSDGRFQCSTCCRIFNRKDYLQKHMLIHTGEKPYNCDYCNTSFRQRSQFRLHLGVKHGIIQNQSKSNLSFKLPE